MEMFFDVLLTEEQDQGIESVQPSTKPQFLDRQTLLKDMQNMRTKTKARNSDPDNHHNKVDGEWRFIGLKKGFSSIPLESLSKGTSRELSI